MGKRHSFQMDELIFKVPRGCDGDNSDHCLRSSRFFKEYVCLLKASSFKQTSHLCNSLFLEVFTS